jgi:hypothetical protein
MRPHCEHKRREWRENDLILEMGAGAVKAVFFQKSRPALPAFRAGSLINIDTIYQAGKADCQKAGKKPAFPAPA